MQRPYSPEQRLLDFDPIEATPEERDRLRRELAFWTREEAAEDFEQLPGETLSEYFRRREIYLESLDTFGPAFPRQPCDAWQMVHGQQRQPPVKRPAQLTLPFD